MDNFISVLIVDDNSSVCSSVSQAVEAMPDMRIAGTASDGQEALQQIAKTLPDVVVLDIIMPNVDGLSVLKALQNSKLPKKPAIFMMSSFDNEFAQQEAAAYGACYFMPKPFDLDQLIKHIRDAIYMTRVSDILREIGVPVQLRGYEYLRQAIFMSILDPSYLKGVTTKLYPLLANSFLATPSRIERAIRHAIKVAWDRIDAQTIERFFDDPDLNFTLKKRPSNLEFIESVIVKAK